MKLEQRTFKPSSKEIEITTLSSAFHIEMNPTDAGHHDKHVIQEVFSFKNIFLLFFKFFFFYFFFFKNKKKKFQILKEIAQSGSLSHIPFKVVILNEVDKLTKEAQQALRRTMEKFSANCRLVLCANSTCQGIQ